MARKARLIDWIMCDDVRQEASGKISIMGIYTDDIVVPVIPTLLPQLWIVTKWDVSEGIFREIILRIEMPDGNLFGSFTAKSPDHVKKVFLMYLAFFPFQIQIVGTYKLLLKVDDEPETKIGEFEVKLAPQKNPAQ